VQTIGIIGGMSWTASLVYYRRLNQLAHERLGGSHSAKCVLWSVDFGEHLGIHDRGGWEAVADEIAGIARSLEAAGADFLIMAVNTAHRVYDEVAAAVAVPILHIADAAAEEIKRAGMRKVGLLGTRHTMNEDFYRVRLAERHGIEVVLPDGPDRAEVDRIIFEELVVDRYEDAARRTVLGLIDRLRAAGAEGVVLGCTELPLLIPAEATSVPLFDTLEIHVRAAMERALG
jgi:aspartate racemase